MIHVLNQHFDDSNSLKILKNQIREEKKNATVRRKRKNTRGEKISCSLKN